VIDKKHQLSDWRQRPLPADMLEYARKDTHYLLPLMRVLLSELRQFCSENEGMEFDGLLGEVYEECKNITLTTYRKPEIFGNFFQKIMQGNERNFSESQKKLLVTLWVF
jgi:exosome complex exonuclease RRP6